MGEKECYYYCYLTNGIKQGCLYASKIFFK